MSEIRNALTSVIINSDMTEPPLRESYLRFKALIDTHGADAVREAALPVLQNGFTVSGEPNPLLDAMRKKLAKVINYENDYRQAERFLNNIFSLQQRENIKVEDFLPFIAAAIMKQSVPRSVWRDVLLNSKETIEGNPVCVSEFAAAFTRLCPPSAFSGILKEYAPNMDLFNTFNITNNHAMHSFAYKAYLVHQELPIVRASSYAWLNNHRSMMLFEGLKALCEERKVTPKQLLSAALDVARTIGCEDDVQKLTCLYKVMDDGLGDIQIAMPKLKPDWFDDTLLDFYNMAVVWNNFKKKEA